MPPYWPDSLVRFPRPVVCGDFRQCDACPRESLALVALVQAPEEQGSPARRNLLLKRTDESLGGRERSEFIFVRVWCRFTTPSGLASVRLSLLRRCRALTPFRCSL